MLADIFSHQLYGLGPVTCYISESFTSAVTKLWATNPRSTRGLSQGFFNYSFLVPTKVSHIYSFTHSIVPQSILRPVRSLFQNEFTTQYDLVLPLSISNTISCPYRHPVAIYVFPLLLNFPYLPFIDVFWTAVPDATFDQSSQFLSLTLCNTSSFRTRSVKMISILLQNHILELNRYFWSTLRSVQVSTPCKAMLQLSHCCSCFREFESNLLLDRFLCLLNAAFAIAVLDLTFGTGVLHLNFSTPCM
jgi:hypothetical protein